MDEGNGRVTTPGPATRRLSLLARIKQAVLGPAALSDDGQAEVNRLIRELRSATEEGRQIVRAGKAQLAAARPDAARP